MLHVEKHLAGCSEICACYFDAWRLYLCFLVLFGVLLLYARVEIMHPGGWNCARSGSWGKLVFSPAAARGAIVNGSHVTSRDRHAAGWVEWRRGEGLAFEAAPPLQPPTQTRITYLCVRKSNDVNDFSLLTQLIPTHTLQDSQTCVYVGRALRVWYEYSQRQTLSTRFNAINALLLYFKYNHQVGSY